MKKQMFLVLVTIFSCFNTLLAQMEFIKRINLGPESGNAVGSNSILIDEPHGRIYIANGGSANIAIFDIETHTVVDMIQTKGNPIFIEKCVYNGFIYIRTDSYVSIFDPYTNTITKNILIGGIGWGSALSDFVIDTLGNRVFATGGDENKVYVIDILTNTVTSTLDVQSYPSTILLDYDNGKIFIGSSKSNILEIYDFYTLQYEMSVTIFGKTNRMFIDRDAKRYLLVEWQQDPYTKIGSLFFKKYDYNFVEQSSLTLSDEKLLEPSAHYFNYDEEYSRIIFYTYPIGGIIDVDNMLLHTNLPFDPGIDITWLEDYYYLIPTEGTSVLFKIKRDLESPIECYALGYGLTDIEINSLDNTVHSIEYGGYNNFGARGYILDGNQYEIQRKFVFSASTEVRLIKFSDTTYTFIHQNHYFEKYEYNSNRLISGFSQVLNNGNTFESLDFIYYPPMNYLIFTGSNFVNVGALNSRVIVRDEETFEIIKVIDVPDDLDHVETSRLFMNSRNNVLLNVVTAYGGGPYYALGNINVPNITKISLDSLAIIDTFYPEQDICGMAIDEEKNIIYTIGINREISIYSWDFDFIHSFNMPYPIFIAVNQVNHDIYILQQEPARLTVVSSDDYSIIQEYELIGNPLINPMGSYNNEAITINYYTGDIFITTETSAEVWVFHDETCRTIETTPSPTIQEINPGDNQITITWQPLDNIRGYYLYRAVEPDYNYIKLSSKLLQDTTHTDLNLTNGLSYAYKVTAMGAYNIESDLSDSAIATPIELPDFQFIPVNYSSTAAIEDTATFTFNIIPESQFATEITFRAKDLPQGVRISFTPDTINTENPMTATLFADATVAIGTYPFQIWAMGGGQTHIIELTLIITPDYSLTCHVDPSTPHMYESLVVFGQLQPGENRTVNVYAASPSGSNRIYTTSTDYKGNYQLEFSPGEYGGWMIYSKIDALNDLTSDTIYVEVQKALSRISCTTDLSDTAEVGWAMTIKGRVFPPPGASTATLHIIKPDSLEEMVEGVLINDEGYYGHNIAADQQGLWLVSASWPGNDEFIGAQSNVLTVPIGLEVGRAIVLRGEDTSGDTLYQTTLDSLANFAYQVLKERRFTDEMIYYLNPNLSIDVNDDGFTNEVDTLPSIQNLEHSILTWAEEAVNDSIGLTIIMIGSGSSEGLQVNDADYLSPAQLGVWLQELVDSTGTDNIHVVVETDFAGQFADDLVSLPATVVTSSDTTHWVYVDYGQISFSNYFWNGIYQGMSIGEAFLTTKDAMIALPEIFNNQLPQIEANGNSIHNEQEDADLAGLEYIGGTYLLGDFPPTIGGAGVTEGEGGLGKFVNPALAYEASLRRATQFGIKLWTRITDDNNENASVRMVLLPPPLPEQDESSFIILPMTDPDGDGRYVATLYDFTGPGIYNAFIYATDASRHTTFPVRRQFFLTEADFLAIGSESVSAPLPEVFNLHQNYPNPFNPYTTILYDLPEPAIVRLTIYDILGREIVRLQDGNIEAGYHQVVWNGKNRDGLNLASGVYISRLVTPKYTKSIKMLLLK